jgi:hypothetical protein
MANRTRLGGLCPVKDCGNAISLGLFQHLNGSRINAFLLHGYLVSPKNLPPTSQPHHLF